MNAKSLPELFVQILGDVPLIAEHFAKQLVDQIRNRFTIINIAWGEQYIQ